jgi:hypothetical protein
LLLVLASVVILVSGPGGTHDIFIRSKTIYVFGNGGFFIDEWSDLSL